MSDSSGSHRLTLLPLRHTLPLPTGASLRDSLFHHGVEFPCGGRGRCKGCRVRLLEGDLPPTAMDTRFLSDSELRDGWRLACQARIKGDLTLEVAQWESTILSDDTPVAFASKEGFGIAVDLGTTTIAAQLLDLSNGSVLAVRTALNTQAVRGADVMSRVQFALDAEGASELRGQIREQIRVMAEAMIEETASGRSVSEMVLVGNTAMHHLFCGFNVSPLAHAPFESPLLVGKNSSGEELGWASLPALKTWFLPCLGGFVGSDVLAGILATRIHESDRPMALIDLGTNGEIVVGSKEKLLCASTAAGPAFEGAKIGMGMRAATGAISAVNLIDGHYECAVLGGGEPRGICGSGLVDAVACALDNGDVGPSGRFTHGSALELAPSVRLVPQDIRELQLAKAAISAGVGLLTEALGLGLEEIETVHLAGAFGNYISRTNARRIGLLPFAPERVKPVGNTALLGAKIALLRGAEVETALEELAANVDHVSLNENARFHEVFIDELSFPAE